MPHTIVGVDQNPEREKLARPFGMTHFVNPKDIKGDLVGTSWVLPKAAPTTASSAWATLR
jgi:Zn-dependent alcohol dehydrogenase